MGNSLWNECLHFVPILNCNIFSCTKFFMLVFQLWKFSLTRNFLYYSSDLKNVYQHQIFSNNFPTLKVFFSNKFFCNITFPPCWINPVDRLDTAQGRWAAKDVDKRKTERKNKIMFILTTHGGILEHSCFSLSSALGL